MNHAKRSPFQKTKLVISILLSSFTLSIIALAGCMMYLLTLTKSSADIEQYNSLLFDTIYIRATPTKSGVTVEFSINLWAFVFFFLLFIVISSLCAVLYKKFVKNKKKVAPTKSLEIT